MANRKWPKEHIDLVANWVRAYPKGGSFDIHRVKAERPDEWQAVASSGKSDSTIQHKGYYIAHKETNPAKVNAGGGRRRFDPATGTYRCAVCNQAGFKSPQQLGSHMRISHPGKSVRWKPSDAVITNHVRPAAHNEEHIDPTKLLKFCPHCGVNLEAHQVAALIKR